MKKNIIGIVLCLATTLGASAQKPGWQWAGIGNDGDYGWASDIAVDGIGNSYVTGTFTGTLIIGSFSLISKGNSDIFWAKFDMNGQVMWAKSAGGFEDDYSGGIALDQEGNLYVGNSFRDSAYYEGVKYISNGWADLCLAKYDSSGNQIWLKTWGSIYDDIGSNLFIESGHLYISGIFGEYGGSPLAYETILFGSIILTSHGDGDMYLVKMDTVANIIWAKNAGSKFADNKPNLCTDIERNVFVTGMTGGTKMIFDTDTLLNKRMYVVKYDSSGHVQWSRGVDCDYPTYGAAVATDNSGNAYVVGGSYLGDLFIFGTATLNSDHAFLAKYSPSGSLLWAKNVGLNSYSGAYDLALDAFNNIYVTGTFEGTGRFGTDTFVSNGYEDIYVNKYDSNGNHIWAVQAGGGSNDGGYGIALDNNGNIVVAGYVSSAPAYFGSHTVSAVGYWDMFVAKLSATTGLPVLPADDKSIRVYPNPAPGIFTVQFEKGFSELRVYDMQGRVVEKRELYPDQKEIRLDGNKWAEGIYRLLLSGKNGIVSAKLIIQKP